MVYPKIGYTNYKESLLGSPKKIGSNHNLADKNLKISFKKPWNYLYLIPSEARAIGEGEIKDSLSSLNREMWTRGDSNS